jgi:hypothetical protein
MSDVRTRVVVQYRGAPGKSAYELWLQEGNSGTVDDYLATVGAEAADQAVSAAQAALAADLSATAADRVATGQDRSATAADRVQTGQDRTATGQDRIAVATDRTGTGQDKTATAADRVATGQDKAATAADRVQTGLDRTATGADRTQTGLDRTAADNSATAAANSAAAASVTAANVPSLTSQLIGVASPVTGAGGTLTGNFSFVPAVAATVTGFIRKVVVATNLAQTATLFVCTLNGDGTLSIVAGSATAVQLAVGVNNLAVKIPITTGQYLGIQGNSLYNQSGNAPATWYTTGLVGTSSSKTIIANHGLQFNAFIESPYLSQLDDAGALVTAYGSASQIGVAAPAFNASAAGTFSLFHNIASPQAGFVQSLRIQVKNTDLAALLLVVNVNGDNTVTLVSSTPIALRPGDNLITYANPAVAAGQYVGVYTKAGVCLVSGKPDAFYISGVPAVSTAKTGFLGSYGLQYNVVVSSGAMQQVANALSDQGGLGDIIPVDNSGVGDATAEILLSRTADPLPYVPAGVYAVTSVRNEGDGLWGPGHIKLNGTHFYIPRAPRVSSLQRQFRAALMRQIADRSGLLLFGDSLLQGDLPTGLNYLDHWTVAATRFVNAFVSPTDLPVFTQFSTGASGGVAHGITLPASPTIDATTGPVNQSLVLAAGQSISLTGLFGYVDVLFERKVGAGSLAFSFNGGAAYKTIDCSGSAASDQTTYVLGTTTGQSASGTYTITATGGPVTITGVIRLGLEADIYRRRLPVINCAVNGIPVTSLSVARIASAVRQAKSFGGNSPGALMAFGENDQTTNLPDTIYANINSKIADVKAGGVKTIWGCDILRPTDTQYAYSAGCSYEGANGAVRAAYQDNGVPIIPLSSIDFVGLGHLTVDGVHPALSGQPLFGQVVVEGIARSFG